MISTTLKPYFLISCFLTFGWWLFKKWPCHNTLTWNEMKLLMSIKIAKACLILFKELKELITLKWLLTFWSKESWTGSKSFIFYSHLRLFWFFTTDGFLWILWREKYHTLWCFICFCIACIGVQHYYVILKFFSSAMKLYLYEINIESSSFQMDL